MLPQVEAAKAFLVQYAIATQQKPSKGRRRLSMPEVPRTTVTTLTQLDGVEITKLKAIMKMAVDGYELYTYEEMRTIQTAPSLIALYNSIQGTSLWQSASRKGTLRTNSVRYRQSLEMKKAP